MRFVNVMVIVPVVVNVMVIVSVVAAAKDGSPGGLVGLVVSDKDYCIG